MRNTGNKWENGSGAVAKYHIQARCNSSIKEMSCYYINKFCGDGIEPKTTVMTAKPKVDKDTGEIAEPRKTEVKLYSYTYAMAWERLSAGHGLISREDRELIGKVSQLLALSTRVRPVINMKGNEYERVKNKIDEWRDKLKAYYEYLNEGSKPKRIWDVVGSGNALLVQATLKQLCNGGKFRFKVEEFKAKYKLVCEEYEKYASDCKDEKEAYKWLRSNGWLAYDAHYNIRVDAFSRYNDAGISEKVRNMLEWIVEVKPNGNPAIMQYVMADIDSVNGYLNTVREYNTVKNHTVEEKERMKNNLEKLLNGMKTLTDMLTIQPKG